MKEAQEQRFVCKICNKSCPSGKSLGGHMRVHSALISASKRAAKFENRMDSEGDDLNGRSEIKNKPNNQSNSTFLNQEKIKNSESTMGLGDDGPKNDYELREKPKKSLRKSDSKLGDVTDVACKECGKVFPSLRALSGHMRCHSIKKSTENQCKKCGKGFDSERALFGHMRSHSKRSKAPDESPESSSDLENLCPLRRKRSRILYKIDPAPSSSVVEFGDVEEVALCLIMLSKGEKNWDRFNAGPDLSDNNSSILKNESFSKDRRIAASVSEGSLFDASKLCNVDKSIGKLNPNPLGSSNSFAEKNVPPFNGLDSCFSGQNDTKFGSEISVEGVSKSSCCDKAIVGAHDSESGKQLFENAPSSHKMPIESDENGEIHRSTQVIGIQNAKLKKLGRSLSLEVDACSLSVVEANSTKIECSVTTSFECPICSRVFPSGQALGGHKRVHYAENKTNESVTINGGFDLNLPLTTDESGGSCVGIHQWWLSLVTSPMRP